MPCDFIYYSADTLFGTDISDVSIRYIDYMDLRDQNNIVSRYADQYEKGQIIPQIIKLLSLSESVLFIVYISIIVLGAEEKNAGDTRQD